MHITFHLSYYLHYTIVHEAVDTGKFIQPLNLVNWVMYKNSITKYIQLNYLLK